AGVDDARRELARQIRGPRAPDCDDELIDHLLAEARTVLDEVQRELRRMLELLGAEVGDASPPAVFHRLSSQILGADTRSKLARAWEARTARATDTLLGIVDAMIDARRRRAAGR